MPRGEFIAVSCHVNLSAYAYAKKERKKEASHWNFILSAAKDLGDASAQVQDFERGALGFRSCAVALCSYYSGLTPVDLSFINAPVFTVKSECTLTRGPSIRPAISCYETCKEHSTGESIKNTAKCLRVIQIPFSFLFFLF